MAAPQQITGGDTGGVAVFYAPPSDGVPNVGAEFLASFVGQRVENAKQLLALRLSSLDPSARYAVMADLARTRQANLAQIASTERAKIGAASDQDVAMKALLTEANRFMGTQLQVQGGLAEKQMDLDAARYKARELSPQGKAILADAIGAIGSQAQEFDQAAQLPDEAAQLAAFDQVNARMVPRLGAVARAAQALDADERDALFQRIGDQVGMYKLSDPDAQNMLNTAAAGAFKRPPEFQGKIRGVGATSIDELAGNTNRLAELLNISTGATPARQSATVERSTSTRAPAPTAGGSQSAPVSSSRGVASDPSPRGTAPAGTGESAPAPIDSTDPDLRRELTMNEALMELVQNYDPQKTLGGLYDPYPGARRETEVTPEMLLRHPRATARALGGTSRRPPTEREEGGSPKPKMSVTEKVSQLFGKKTEEPADTATPEPKEIPKLISETGRPWSGATQNTATPKNSASSTTKKVSAADTKVSAAVPSDFPEQAKFGSNPMSMNMRLQGLYDLYEKQLGESAERTRQAEDPAEVAAAKEADAENKNRNLLEDVQARDAGIDESLHAKEAKKVEDEQRLQDTFRERGEKIEAERDKVFSEEPDEDEQPAETSEPTQRLQDRIRQLEAERRKRYTQPSR